MPKRRLAILVGVCLCLQPLGIILPACGEDESSESDPLDAEFPPMGFDLINAPHMADQAVVLGDTGLQLLPPAGWRRLPPEDMATLLQALQAPPASADESPEDADAPEDEPPPTPIGPAPPPARPQTPRVEPLLVLTDPAQTQFILADLLPASAGTTPADIPALLTQIPVSAANRRGQFTSNGLRMGQTLRVVSGSQPDMYRPEFQLFVAAPTNRLVHIMFILSEVQGISPDQLLIRDPQSAKLVEAVIASVRSHSAP